MSKKKTSRSRREKLLQARLIRRIYAIFRRHKTDPKGGNEWTVRLARIRGNAHTCERLNVDHDVVGMLDVAHQILYVDLSADIIPTFVHECVHILLEDSFENDDDRTREEAEVQRIEALMMRHLTPRQAKNILLLITRELLRKTK